MNIGDTINTIEGQTYITYIRATPAGWMVETPLGDFLFDEVEVYEDDEYEDDGQPSEYDEWQDVYGGDVEEYGTFGDYDNGEDW